MVTAAASGGWGSKVDFAENEKKTLNPSESRLAGFEIKRKKIQNSLIGQKQKSRMLGNQKQQKLL